MIDLYISDLLSSQEACTHLQLYQDRTQMTLSHYTAITSPCRFGTLLLVLPILNGPITATVQNLLFKPIIGSVPIEHIIAVI